MARLEGLIKIRKQTVEEKQKILGGILNELSVLEHRKEALETRLQNEKDAIAETDDITLQGWYGRFSGAVRAELEMLSEDIQKVETRLDVIREEVRAAFMALKQVEIVDERRRQEVLDEIKARESRLMDEIGIDTFRKKTEG